MTLYLFKAIRKSHLGIDVIASFVLDLVEC